jgi:probable HAF family extracellular repeat protein
VVGGGSSANGEEAFRWTAGGGMAGLGDLPGGAFSSQAFGVSADGATVVGGGSSANGIEAFRWTAGGGMVGLGDLPGGQFLSAAWGVSADGATVVGSGSSANGEEAFRWTAGGGMAGLGDLPGGAFSSQAFGVSADGATVVGTGISDIGQEAFLWTPQDGMRRLQDVLTVDLGLDLTGWTLFDARAVTPDGLTIVGTGTHNGNTEAFVAVIPIVPEPAAGALALLGVSSILLLRRRSLWRPNKVSLSKDEPCN